MSAVAPRRCSALVTALPLLALAASACAPNDVSLSIQQMQVPIVNTGMMSGCSVSATSTSFRNEGVLDVALGGSYTLFPLYRNELYSSADPSVPRAELRGIVVEGADVDLHRNDPNGLLIVDRFQVSDSTFVPPRSGGSAGLSVGTLNIIPPTVVARLQQQACRTSMGNPGPRCNAAPIVSQVQSISAVIRPFGHTMGGIELQGAPFTFALTVCCGCLVSFANATTNAMTGVATCSNSTGMTGTSSTPPVVPCNIGQDDVVDCRVCSAFADACRPECR